MGSPAIVGPTIATRLQATTAYIAGATLPSLTAGVASTAKTSAKASAASTGRIASHALVTPNAVSRVCSRLPSPSQLTQVAVPMSPRSGYVSAAASIASADGIASPRVTAGNLRYAGASPSATKGSAG